MLAASGIIRFIGISLALGAVLFSALTRAEQPAGVSRVGVLVPVPSLEEGLRHSLLTLGYVEGKTIVIEWRRSTGTQEQLRPIAADLVRSKVDLIVTWGDTCGGRRVGRDEGGSHRVLCGRSRGLGDGSKPGEAGRERNRGGAAYGGTDRQARRASSTTGASGSTDRLPEEPIQSDCPAPFRGGAASRARTWRGVGGGRRPRYPVNWKRRSGRFRRRDSMHSSFPVTLSCWRERARIAGAVRGAKLPTIFPGRRRCSTGR